MNTFTHDHQCLLLLALGLTARTSPLDKVRLSTPRHLFAGIPYPHLLTLSLSVHSVRLVSILAVAFATGNRTSMTL